MTIEKEAAGSKPSADAQSTLTWNMYGAGLENIGRDDQPEVEEIPEPGPDQMLVRVDAVGMCFSDVKLIKQGRNHPKLYNRDLTQYPTRLGHEATVTVIKVGENLQENYSEGQRLAIQPDIYQDGKSTAYGYTIPGGLIQYHLIGSEVLVTDAGACVLPLDEGMGYAEAALLEPWGCVMASYTQRRRLTPLAGGIMWILGEGSTQTYQFSDFMDRPATIILTDAPESLAQLAQQTGAEIVVRNGLSTEDYATLSKEMTDGRGFDDIVMIEPSDADEVSEVARHIARRGTLNLVGQEPINGLVQADVGRLHYDYIAFVGTSSSDIAASYGEARNRCELHPNGTAVFIGAGGPMGQMHVQRALELPDGPKTVIATDINQERLDAIIERFGAVAEENSRHLHVLNPTDSSQTPLPELVSQLTDGIGADDVIVSVPHAGLMADAAELMNPNGMLVLFAGVPNGTEAPLDVSHVYLNNMQFTGTSGLTIEDQAQVMARATEGSLSPEKSVAAVGGMNVVKEGLQAMMDGRYPGKIVIFPQIEEMPLMGLDELASRYPEIGQHLGAGNSWTDEVEAKLMAHFLAVA